VKHQSRPASRHPFLAASTLFGEGAGQARSVDNITSCVFESSVKIFAPLFRYQAVPKAWMDKTWSDFGVRLFEGAPGAFSDMSHAHVTYLIPPEGFPGALEPVSLQDIYAELGLAWNHSSSVTELLLSLETPSLPCELFGPEEGTLHENTLRALLPALRAHTRSTALNCYFDIERAEEVRASAGASSKGRSSLATSDLFTTDFEQILAGARPEGFVSSTPCMLWPDDERWCVHSDYDSTYILVSGHRAFIDDVLDAALSGGIDAVLVDGAPALAELEGDPDKKGLLWDAFPSPYAFGPLSLDAYRAALRSK